MKIALLQTDIQWGSPTLNAHRAEMLMEGCSDCEMMVLPEMWSTGFATEPEQIAETDNQSFCWMRKIAEERKVAVGGSVAVKTADGTFRNRHYFVCPDGQVTVYDKHHLFTYGGENAHYKAGHQRAIACYGGMRFLLLTCYDLRFPIWSRNRGDFDVMVYVANWPTSRLNAWQTLLRARAIENQAYVVAVNRVGHDKVCEYPGHSCIISPKGETLVECGSQETAVTANINMEELERFRKKFPVLADADPFELT